MTVRTPITYAGNSLEKVEGSSLMNWRVQVPLVCRLLHVESTLRDDQIIVFLGISEPQLNQSEVFVRCDPTWLDSLDDLHQ